MNTADKNKLKHNLINSIVIINSMTKSAENFLNRLPICADEDSVDQQQREKFLNSMKSIREQTTKIENYFESLIRE